MPRLGLRKLSSCIISANMNIDQCRMARAALGWSVADLAQQSGVAARTIARFEVGEAIGLAKVEALRSALVRSGVLFVQVEGRPGVTYLRED
jgi:transcriptional regulator with XRE-family HTH domain